MFWAQQEPEVVLEGEAESSVDVSPMRLIGFTLYCVWLLMMFYSVALYDTETDYRTILYLNQFVSLAFLVVTIVLVARFVKRADKFVLSKRVIYPYSAVLALTTAVGCMTDGSNVASLAVFAACAVLTGICSGLLFLGWFRLYTDAGGKTAAIEVSAGWLLGCVLTMMLFYLPRPADIAIVTLAAAASGLLLRQCAFSRPQRPQPQREHRLHTRTRRMFVRGALAAACIGMVDGFSDLITGYRYIQIPFIYDIVLMAGAACVMAVVLVAVMRTRRSVPSTIYRIAIFCMVAGSLGTPFLESAYSVPASLIFGGYLGFLVLLVVICTDISNYFDLPATKVVGYALAAQYAGELLGLLLAFGLTEVGPVAEPWVFNMVTLLLTGLLVLAFLFLFTERDLVETSVGELIDTEDDQQASAASTQEEDLARTVAHIQETYGLSARETDVLPLLIKGRTIARIQEELFISQGTVSTHIRHIYQKTGVHNRQALLDLIDELPKTAGKDGN